MFASPPPPLASDAGSQARRDALACGPSGKLLLTIEACEAGASPGAVARRFIAPQPTGCGIERRST